MTRDPSGRALLRPINPFLLSYASVTAYPAPSCYRTLAVPVHPAPWPQGQGLALLLFFFYQPRSPFSVPTLRPDGIPSTRCQSQLFLTCSYNLLHPFLPHHSQSSLPSRPAKDAARTKSERSPPPAPSITPSHHPPFPVLTASPPRDAAPQSTLLASIRLLQPYLTLMTLLDPNLPFHSPPLLFTFFPTLNSSLSTLHFSHPAPPIATSRNAHPHQPYHSDRITRVCPPVAHSFHRSPSGVSKPIFPNGIGLKFGIFR